MKVLVYSAKDFEIPFLRNAMADSFDLTFTQDRLTGNTAMKALGYQAISIFSADDASSNVLEKLYDFGVKFITLRSTGYDNVQLKTAAKFKIKVANAPGYSPNAIAEHAIALLMALNRKIVLANNQVKNQNFRLSSLVGFDLYKKTVGVVGVGAIGTVLVDILNGFGCKVLANDLETNTELVEQGKVRYVTKERLFSESDVVILSVPLTAETHHLINDEVLSEMKKSALLINIARGGIVHTKALLDALYNGEISGYATDVYEKEGGIFFYNHQDKILRDKLLLELINHPKVLLTPHQAFATQEALTHIAETTRRTLDHWRKGEDSPFEISYQPSASRKVG